MGAKRKGADGAERTTYAATFAAGGVAGAISRTLTAPLDRIKILAQEGLIHSSAPRTVLDSHGIPVACARFVKDPRVYLERLRGQSKLLNLVHHVYEEGGLRSFWRGNGVNCLKAGPEFALVFYVRSLFAHFVEVRQVREQARLEQTPGSFAIWTSLPRPAVNFFGGAVAGATAQSILYPLEVIKTRLAVAKSGEYPGGIRDCIVASYRRGGFADFYRGLSPNLAGIVPYRGMEVGLFYTLRQQLETQKAEEGAKNSDLTVSETAVLGTVSSVVSQTITYPLNIARTRLQTQGVNGRPILYTGMVDCFVKVLKTDGFCGLFSGLGANYLKAVPASAIVFVAFSRTEAYLQQTFYS